MDPFIRVDERVDVKEYVKLQLLVFAPVATEESDKEATPSSSNVTTEHTESTDATDDGETVPISKRPKSGPLMLLFRSPLQLSFSYSP